MTSNDHRAQCIEAMADDLDPRWRNGNEYWRWFIKQRAAKILDSLHGIAFVDPIEATKEMQEAGYNADARSIKACWHAMAARGNLTNPPEEKNNAPRVSGLAEHWPTNLPEEKQ